MRAEFSAAVLSILLSLVGAGALSAQAFIGLSADAQGLRYVTSSFILKAPKPANAGNVFEYTRESGWRWFVPAWGPVDGVLDVSADGTVFAVNKTVETLQCGSKNCVPVSTATGRVVAPHYRLDAFQGSVQISRNGRYAALTNGTVVDLSTGASRSFVGTLANQKQALTNRGCVLLATFGAEEMLVNCAEGETRFKIYKPSISYSSLLQPTIDPDGTRILYANFLFGETYSLSVRSLDLNTGQDAVVFEQTLGSIVLRRIAVSSDLRQIVYLAPVSGVAAEIFLNGKQLTFTGEGFLDASIADDGLAIYAVSSLNRVVRIATASREMEEIIPRTPGISGSGYGVSGMVPGSLAVVWGGGFGDLQEAKVTLNGRSVPVVTARPGALQFQVPPDTPRGPVEIDVPSRSPFEVGHNWKTTVTGWDLYFLDLSSDPSAASGITAIHQDFSGTVTLENPAQPDEIIHFYAVGLGPVASTPPFTVVKPLECSVRGGSDSPTPVPVLYAGLAPNLTGIYQVSVQLPSSFDLKPGQRIALLFCSTAGEESVPGTAFAVSNSPQL